MKKFDDIFRENVVKVFSHYDAGHLSDEGWNSFVKGKKGRRRILAIIPLWAKAATVAVIIGAGGFLIHSGLTRHTANETIAEISSPSGNEPVQSVTDASARTVTPPIAGLPQTVISSGKPDSPVPVSRGEKVTEIDTIVREDEEGEEGIIYRALAEDSFVQKDDSAYLPAEVEVKTVLADKTPLTLASVPEGHSGKTSLMAGFSGLLAHADESGSSAPGVSVGLYLDQKITRRLSVRPGLALSRQSVGLGSSEAISSQNYTVPLSDGTGGKVDSFNGQLDMLTLEVPLNIVFRILEKGRSGFYISGGASTMIYLDQQFTADYVNEYTKQSYSTMSNEVSTETRYSTVEVENSYGAFSRVDLFRLVNFSAGYQLPYGKSGTMIIEPFVQLPVSDLTSLNMKVRYAGVSFKIRFGKQAEEER